ncbi:hypothetical protein J5N97_028631 [Dioscorea zingiberensis]|uniref:CCHC-type domain-containing protein n=1 Tax=Dioscorea zingiberensis TaxID=325984 RepID=A0A9D5BZH7_9LILI|nr:hypothetical protein J5N97_028631 [Dioscorea zingiberensis]
MLEEQGVEPGSSKFAESSINISEALLEWDEHSNTAGKGRTTVQGQGQREARIPTRSPYREGVSYAQALTGAVEEDNAMRFDWKAPSIASTDEGWTEIHFKRKKISRGNGRLSSPLANAHSTRRSLPNSPQECSIRLQFGHNNTECHRLPTCRSCGRIGHRGYHCPARLQGRPQGGNQGPTKAANTPNPLRT